MAINHPDVLRSIDDLRPAIVDARIETESGRRVPPHLGAELADRGLGRLLLGEEFAGHDLDAITYMTVMEELGAAEGSVALVVWNSCVLPLVSRHLDQATRSEIFANPNAMYANSTRPTGRAVAITDGYQVSGRWSLVTGCQLAEWFALMCLVWDPTTDAPVKDGRSIKLVMAVVPADDVEIIDTWDAGGMRGSGSHDVAITDLSLPAAHVVDFASPNLMLDAPLGRVKWMSLLAAGFGAVALGIARGASQAFVELMAGKVSPDTGATASENPAMLVEYLRAEERVRAARALLNEGAAEIWSHAVAGTDASDQAVSEMFGAAYNAGHSAKDLTATLVDLGGTAALYSTSPIERAWRDMTAAAQHVLLGPVVAEQAGRIRMGLEPKVPLFFQ